MGLTLTQIKRATGLSHFQARRLTQVPFPAAGTQIKRHSAGRRVITYSFSDLAPRLHACGMHPDIIAELAVTSTLDDNPTQKLITPEDYDYDREE